MEWMGFSNKAVSYWMLAMAAVAASGCQVHIKTPDSTSTGIVALAPAIFSVVPSNAPITGGSTITITGQNFNPQTTVTIADLACSSMDYISATEIQCQVPPHPSGSVSLTVVGPNQPIASAAFTYFPVTHGIPNFTVNLGGGISAKADGGKGFTVVSSSGEAAQALHQSATGISVHSGIVGAISGP